MMVTMIIDDCGHRHCTINNSCNHDDDNSDDDDDNDSNGDDYDDDDWLQQLIIVMIILFTTGDNYHHHHHKCSHKSRKDCLPNLKIIPTLTYAFPSNNYNHNHIRSKTISQRGGSRNNCSFCANEIFCYDLAQPMQSVTIHRKKIITRVVFTLITMSYSAPYEVVPYTEEPFSHHWWTPHPP